MEENKELLELTDELVSKAGPNAGQIKVNQDPAKVARLQELGWKPKEEHISYSYGSDKFDARLKKVEEIVANHEKRIAECSIRR